MNELRELSPFHFTSFHFFFSRILSTLHYGNQIRNKSVYAPCHETLYHIMRNREWRCLLRKVMCPCSMSNLTWQDFTTQTNNNCACRHRCNNYNKRRPSTTKYRKYNLKIVTQFIVTTYNLLSTNSRPRLFLHYLKVLSLHGKK